MGLLVLCGQRCANQWLYVAASLECVDRAIELPERGLCTPSQCSVALTDDVWRGAFIVSNGAAKDLFIDVVLLEAVHEDIDVLGKIGTGMPIPLLRTQSTIHLSSESPKNFNARRDCCKPFP